MQMGEIEILANDRVTHGEYLAQIGENTASGKLTWTLRNGARDAEHTMVPPEMRGRGVAALLVEALVRDARSKGFKVFPSCSYVAAQFDRHPDWADLRA